jgi:hypothetical protein
MNKIVSKPAKQSELFKWCQTQPDNKGSESNSVKVNNLINKISHN